VVTSRAAGRLFLLVSDWLAVHIEHHPVFFLHISARSFLDDLFVGVVLQLSVFVIAASKVIIVSGAYSGFKIPSKKID